MPNNAKALERAVAEWCLRNNIPRHDQDSRLYRMANAIRDEYTRYRRRQFNLYGGPSRYGEVYWLKCATMLLDRSVDPAVYVDHVFRIVGSRTMPGDLLHPHYIETCLHRDPKRQDGIAQTLRQYIERFSRDAGNASTPEQLSALLDDPAHFYGPLFKWYCAKRYGIQRHIDQYEALAKRLLLDPDYAAVYSSVFKEG